MLKFREINFFSMIYSNMLVTSCQKSITIKLIIEVTNDTQIRFVVSNFPNSWATKKVVKSN